MYFDVPPNVEILGGGGGGDLGKYFNWFYIYTEVNENLEK